MFTGLVQEIGTLRSASPRGGVLRLVIQAARTAPLLSAGDSVAVNGICLTAVGVRGDRFIAEAAAETRRLTTLGSWHPGRRVHLEPALRLGDALDGHLVQGHVDGIGRVLSLKFASGGHHLRIAYPPQLGRYLTPKGSVAIDGVSLTVDETPGQGTLMVNLIPYTMRQTTFATLRTDDTVNLEMDVLVKSALQGGGHPLAAAAVRPDHDRTLTLEKILAAGFAPKSRRGA